MFMIEICFDEIEETNLNSTRYPLLFTFEATGLAKQGRRWRYIMK